MKDQAKIAFVALTAPAASFSNPSSPKVLPHHRMNHSLLHNVRSCATHVPPALRPAVVCVPHHKLYVPYHKLYVPHHKL